MWEDWIEFTAKCAFKVESEVGEPVNEAIDEPQIITLFSSIS